MKLLYSDVKKFIPTLKASPREVGEALTLVGYLMDGFEEVSFNGKKDFLISLEVRQNRPDLQSAIGLAREVSAYFQKPFILPKLKVPPYGKQTPNIAVKAREVVKSVAAIEMAQIKNVPSPKWLQEAVTHYGMNSLNLLVDISNYVMLMTGYPNHIFDKEKIEGTLTWSLNDRFKEMVTFDGTIAKFQGKGKELLIHDDKKPLSTALVGGQFSGVSLGTTSIVMEVATYTPTLIRKNSRDLNIVTESSRRLEKPLDPNGIYYALDMLVSLIAQYAGGRPTSKRFVYQPKKYVPTPVAFDPAAPSQYAGIPISEKQSETVLKHLRFSVKKGKSLWSVTPPSDRTDIEIQEDVIEEVVRMIGYNTIPANETPALSVVPLITPPHLIVAEKLRDLLSAHGLDEIAALPMTTPETNRATNYQEWEEILTQNSINEEFPSLRQSLAGGLVHQLQEYVRKNVEFVDIFEISKIFGKRGNNYEEYDALGVITHDQKQGNSLKKLQATLEMVLRALGVNALTFRPARQSPMIANPYSSWDILIRGTVVGILCKLKPQKLTGNAFINDISFAEINVWELTNQLGKAHLMPVVELTEKLVILDTNIELPADAPVQTKLEEIEKKIGSKHAFNVRVADAFPTGNKIRYTVRVSYKGLSDQEAKDLHAKIF